LQGYSPKIIRVALSGKLPLGEIYNGLCENCLLNLKDYEHEKRRAALAKLSGSGDGKI